jgi:hypothetical protein
MIGVAKRFGDSTYCQFATCRSQCAKRLTALRRPGASSPIRLSGVPFHVWRQS